MFKNKLQHLRLAVAINAHFHEKNYLKRLPQKKSRLLGKEKLTKSFRNFLDDVLLALNIYILVLERVAKSRVSNRSDSKKSDSGRVAWEFQKVSSGQVPEILGTRSTTMAR